MSTEKPRLIFYLNHPAHYHLFKHPINGLLKKGYPIKVLIVKKDVLEDLVKQEAWDWVNIFPEGRRLKNVPILASTLVNLVKAEFRLWHWVSQFKPKLIVGTEGTIAHTAFLRGIKSLIANEDDTKATPENYLFYPFATKLLLPECCDRGMWDKNKITYNSYHELAYLHPRYFKPNVDIVKKFHPNNEPYFIVRLAELSASHDVGKKGLGDGLVRTIIDRLSQRGKVYITSERPLKPEFEPYRLAVPAHEILDVLSFAQMYIGDSQTMTAEAAVLGTPALRYNDFVGRLGYLNELEKMYELTYGFRTSESKKLLDKLDDLLQMAHLKEHWANKRKILLTEKIDVSEFMITVVEDLLREGRQ